MKADYDFEKDGKENSEISIVLCGETVIGKTALVDRYEHRHFEDPRPTIHDTKEFTKYLEDSDKQLKIMV